MEIEPKDAGAQASDVENPIPRSGTFEVREQERRAIDAVAVGRAARFYSFYSVSERLKQLAKL